MQSLVPRAITIIIENGEQAKYFGGKFNFPCACIFCCSFSVLWVLAVISPHTKMPTPANDATGSHPAQCCNATNEACMKDIRLSLR